MKLLIFFVFSFSLVEPLLAEQKVCFPIGRAWYDRDCHDFTTESACLNTQDTYSCGWGKQRENPLDEEELLTCENSRCPDSVDEESDPEDS